MVAQAQQPTERVPMGYRPPTLVVEASVNGSEPLLFAFDTGSSTCLIDTKVAARLGIEPVARPGREGPGFARARTLAVGKAVAHDLELVIRDLSPLSERVGAELAGIIGFTWMEQFVFEIDYRAARLTLWPRSVELTPRSDQLPLPLEVLSAPGFTGATLYVPATLNDTHSCPMEIDTGTDIPILGRQMAAQVGADIARAQALGNGRRAGHVVERLEIAGRVFANLVMRVAPRRGADGNPYAQCVIGNQQLKAFALTIDIPRRRAFFRRVLPLPPPE